MSPATVETVLDVLEGAGFERLPRPLVVGGSAFDFDAALRGTGLSHDLVVIASAETSSRRLLRLLSGLGRVLDQLGSRRPVTLVLVGQSSEASLVADLEQHARVLAVDGQSPLEQVRRALAVLLPLTLPASSASSSDPLATLAAVLGPTATAEHEALVRAAGDGPDAVREALRQYIDAAVTSGDLRGEL